MTSMASHQPPRILRCLLRMLNREDVFLAIIGDFDEEFQEIVRTEGPAVARRWYWRQFARSLPGSLKENAFWRIDMIKNYIRLAVRNILRQKALSAINIFGLSIALACGLWIYLFVADELSFNQCHENAKRLYSIINTDHYFQYTYRFIPPAVGPATEEFFPEVERSTRFAWMWSVIQYGAVLSQERLYLADPAFLEMFSFRVIRGNRLALADKNAVFLTRSIAAKYFGQEDPLGRSLTISFDQKKKDFRVAGILEDAPANSTIRFKILISIANADMFWGPDVLRRWTGNLAETYVQLRPGVDSADVDARFRDFVRRYFAQVIDERKAHGTWTKEGETITFWLQNIKDIHFHSQNIGGELRSSASKSIVLGMIGLLFLLVSGINFTNLSAGRASRRTVEIAMRRVLGADRKNLLRQFWGESIVTVAFSMALGIILAGLFLPLFNSLSNKSFFPAELMTLPIAGIVVLLTVIVGVLAGSYPALILAGVNPVRIFKGERRIGKKSLFSSVLIIVQFSIAVLLLISTLTMSRQIRFIQERDLGFNSRDLIVIDNQERDPAASEKAYRLFKEKASTLTSVKSVGGCVFVFAERPGEGTIRYRDKRIHFSFSEVSAGYFDTLGMTFLEGADFQSDYPEGINPVIVNERFVRLAGIEHPLGETLGSANSPLRIVGVIDDYHYRSMHFEIEPALHLLSPRVSTILVRIAAGSAGGTIPALKDIWSQLRPDKPFIYKFLDSMISDQYAEERRWNAIIQISSALVILITSMGLIGLTMVIVNRKIKEVGIRRVLGASKASLCMRLSGNFLLLGAAANLLAWPTGYVIMRQWLNRYPYRAGFPVEAFFIAGILLFLVILVTIGALIFKMASTNPAETLRYD
jgi:putative ABC transport system permease protein